MLKSLKIKIYLSIFFAGLLLLISSQSSFAANETYENVADTGYTIIFSSPRYSDEAVFPEHTYEYLIKNGTGISLIFTNWELAYDMNENCLVPVGSYLSNWEEHSQNFVNSNICRSYYSSDCIIDNDNKVIRLNNYRSSAFHYSDTNSITGAIYNFASDVEPTFLGSSLDIYKYDSTLGALTDQVFPVPPKGILAPLYKGANMAQVMKEILEILPVIMIIIVGLISLRKGLSFLSTVLHRA